jgi:hypothetical protein
VKTEVRVEDGVGLTYPAVDEAEHSEHGLVVDHVGEVDDGLECHARVAVGPAASYAPDPGDLRLEVDFEAPHLGIEVVDQASCCPVPRNRGSCEFLATYLLPSACFLERDDGIESTIQFPRLICATLQALPNTPRICTHGRIVRPMT